MSTPAPTYIYPPLTSDPSALYAQFKAYMQAWIPGWKPYSGELDDWLARAFTGIAATLTELTSDVATSIFRYFGAFIMNLPPNAATPATGNVTITVKDANGPYDIPAYTEMSFPDASGTLQGFETLADVSVPSGSTSITNIPVQAMTPGAAGNSCSGSGSLDSTGIAYITGLSLVGSTVNGTDAETDAAYLNRLAQSMTTLTLSPITNADFTILAEVQAGVGRAITLSTFNPANWTTSGTTNITGGTANQVTVASTANIPIGAPVSGTGIPANTYVTGITSSTVFTMSANATAAGTTTVTIGGQKNQGGYVTTWVLGTTDVLSSSAMSTIQSTIQAMCLTNVNYSVQAPTKNTVNITASVVAWTGVDPTATQTAIQNALNSFLATANFGTNLNPSPSSPSTLGWLNDTTVRVSVIQNVIMNVPGVHYVTSVQINGASADLALSGVVPVTTPGTMTITVTNG